jgi:L-asparaginase II
MTHRVHDQKHANGGGKKRHEKTSDSKKGYLLLRTLKQDLRITRACLQSRGGTAKLIGSSLFFGHKISMPGSITFTWDRNMDSSHLSSLTDAPTLVEIFRGITTNGYPIIECVHQGLICIVDGHGHVIYSHGEGLTRVHMRSCAKPFQVLPLLELGFFDDNKRKHLNLCLSDLTLMMSSHSGQNIHTSRISELLTLIGLDQFALRCGIHPPQDEFTRRELIRTNTDPSVLHNNCSGKHTAMLMTCLAQGFDIHSYENEKHPLQQWIRKTILMLASMQDHEIAFGIDGCSLPSWAIPLKNLALMYARLAYWQEHLPHDKPMWLKNAFKKIWTSAATYPQFLAGDNCFDTELIRASSNRIFCKTGADGLLALAILPSEKYPSGVGIAIKITDGDAKQHIRPLVVKKLLSSYAMWPSDPLLDRFLPSFKNYRGLLTGGALYQFKKDHRSADQN